MMVGHYASALIAEQKFPRGHLAYYLLAAQLQDFLWHGLSLVGVEPTTPDNPMTVSLDNIHADMTYSHDLLPLLGWMLLVAVIGRAAFQSWRPAAVGAALVALHAATDYLAGYPHFVFGPDSQSVATALYHSAPYSAVAFEAVFTAAALAWVLRADAAAGRRRTRGVYAVWAAVFGGGLAFLFVTADLSLSELTGWEPIAALSGGVVPFLLFNYALMLGGLIWAGAQPTRQVA